MKYAVVYSSRTGNTALLAQALKKALPESDCLYFGSPASDTAAEAAERADLIFTGFWTDKGDCAGDISGFLEKLRNKNIFLFGTAGFGGEPTYFDRIVQRVRQHTDASDTVVGSYMCQGKMPLSVRQRYESQLAQNPERTQQLLDNFDAAQSHPDEQDAEKLVRLAAGYIRQLQ